MRLVYIGNAMKRMHIHLGVEDLASSVKFYTSLFGVTPTVLEADYAKWALEDPRVNFAISNRCLLYTSPSPRDS